MKKFLTVLLVIAVMFTFSFSSAFATVGNPTAANLEIASKYLDDATSAAQNQFAIAYTPTYGASAVAYVNTQLAGAKATILAALISVYDLDTTAGMTNYKAEVAAWTTDTGAAHIGTDTGLTAYQTKYTTWAKGLASAKQAYYEVDDANKAVNAVDTTLYSTKDYKTSNLVYDFVLAVDETGSNTDFTNKTYADMLVASAKKELEAITLDVADGRLDGTYTVPNVAGSDYIDYLNAILYGYKEDISGTPGEVYTADTNTRLLPTADNDTTKVHAGLFGKLNALTLVTDEPTVDAQIATAISYAKAVVSNYYNVTAYNKLCDALYAGVDITSLMTNDYDNDATTYFGVKPVNKASLTATEVSAIKKGIIDEFAAALEVMNVALDNCETIAAVDSLKGTLVPGSAGTYAEFNSAVTAAYTAIDSYKAVERTAATKKLEYGLDGTKTYNDADIDEALAKDKVYIYKNAFGTPVTAKYVGLVSTTNALAEARAEAKAKWGDTISYTAPVTAEADKKYKGAYYDSLYAEAIATANSVKAFNVIYADTVDAIDDAKTVDEVNAAMAAADVELAKLRTAAELETLQKPANKAEIEAYADALDSYATQMNSFYTAKGGYPAGAVNAILADYVFSSHNYATTYPRATAVAAATKFELARSMDEIKSLYDEAMKAMNSIKTVKELEAEADKVIAQITALPAAATVANEDAYMAAYDAYTAYLDIPGAAKTDIPSSLVFEGKMAELQTAQETEIAKMVAALPTVVTAANKAEVEAIRAAYDKYVEYYEDDAYKFASDPFSAASKAALKTAETAVSNDEVAKVRQAIAKLTDSSTAAEIAAAKAAYDALTGSQQTAVGAQYAYKLAQLSQTDDAAAKAYVQDLGIKARSAKTSKGVKVTIKADVQSLLDAGFTVEYKFYRSTKSNKGFKAMVTKTTGTYTNTKGVKGTKYYYKAKLVVKNAAGEVVATTPLTQCLYATRTF